MMLPSLPILLISSLLSASAIQLSDAGVIYANRLTLQASDDACAFLDTPERLLLDGLIDRSRDDAHRAQDDPERLKELESEYTRRPNDCDTPLLLDMVEDHKRYVADLASSPEIEFSGLHQDWISRRNRFGGAGWTVFQPHSSQSAILGLASNEDTYSLTLAFRNNNAPAFATMTIRDTYLQTEPLDFTAGGLLNPPNGDPISSWGGAKNAQRRFFASERLSNDVAQQLAPASGQDAFGFLFPKDSLTAILELTPREGIRIDLMGTNGQVDKSLWFEVGMIKAALATQSLALSASDDTQTPAP